MKFNKLYNLLEGKYKTVKELSMSPETAPIRAKVKDHKSCTVVTLELTILALENGLYNFKCVEGIVKGYDSDYSHYWIEENGQVVDLTADKMKQILNSKELIYVTDREFSPMEFIDYIDENKEV